MMQNLYKTLHGLFLKHYILLYFHESAHVLIVWLCQHQQNVCVAKKWL